MSDISVAEPKKSATGLPKTTRIILEENDLIPPTGLYVGDNGRGYLIRPGEEVDVPFGVLDILKSAIMSVPQVDPQTLQVIGYRDKPMYSFRVISV